ncbi:DUF1707 SHOCT-like domain-containing protein [Glycomyces tarimensis]
MSTPDPNMRVSNAEREAIIARLHAATEEGRLELDEFAERSRNAYAAKTYGELQGLLDDLPDPGGTLAVPKNAAPLSRRAASAPAELRLNPKASSVERKGEWIVPSSITVNAKASSVKLDFRHAVIRDAEVEIDGDLIASSLELVLPAGGYAVDEHFDVMASSVANRCPYKGQNGVRFIVRGRAKASSVSVRYERRFLWWRW